jgi:23S rRNA pseudouridine2605 synthase
MSQDGERVQKVLARAGFGSRRSCEDLIRQGRVFINGQVAELGQRADPDRDQITVDGRLVQVSRSFTYIALYKPPGVLSAERDASDRQQRTVRDLVSLPGRLYPVGRLDLDSEGLIVLTNDGELTNLLTHPRYEHSKEYRVDVEGHPTDKTLDRWRRGVYLDNQRTAPAEVSVISHKKDHTQLRIVLREGRKRQIRRVATNLGHPVRRLVRVRIGPVELGDLTPGQWRPLSDRELAQLRALKQERKRSSTHKR